MKRLWRKSLAVVLSFGMAFSAGMPTAAFAAEEAQEAYTIGQRMHGFVLEEQTEMPSIHAQAFHWIHEKTGASVWFVQNEDQNRCFSLTFRTEPSDDTGKLHILEHAVCASSEKYPGQDVFFDAIGQAYLTEMNAMTALSATNYYVSSMSENQLERLADFYLDSAFHSSLREEKRFFEREGWRYELEDADAPLTIEGIVYNEMQGMYSDPDMTAINTLHKALYPDTYQQFESGGLPAEIPNLTYEDLIAFYDACYHPSNCTVMLYGDLETERFLKLLDEGYFAAFDRAEGAVYSKVQEPLEAPVRADVAFPVSADNTKKEGTLLYGIALPEEMTLEERELLDMLMYYLYQDTTPFMQAMNASGIAADYTVYMDTVGTQPELMFWAEDADMSRAEEFQELVEQELAAVVEIGVEADVMESLIARQELKEKLTANDTQIGVSLAEAMLRCIDNGQEAYFAEELEYDVFREALKQNSYQELLEKYVLHNPHAALVTVTPEAGLLEKQAAELEAKLAEKKAAMSEEELNQLIEKTADFAEWSQVPTEEAVIESLKTETSDTLDISVQTYPTETEKKNGVKIYTAQVDGDLSYCEYRFDLSHLDVRQLQEMQVYCQLQDLSTKSKDEKIILLESGKYLQKLYSYVTVLEDETGKAYPAFRMGFYTDAQTLEQAIPLAMEMVTEVAIAENAEKLQQNILLLEQTFYDVEGLNEFYGGSISQSAQYSRLDEMINGLGFCEFLTQLKVEWQEDSAAVMKRMEQTREEAFAGQDTAVFYVGNAESAEAAVKTMCDVLPEQKQTARTGNWTQLPDLPKNTAISADTAASYVLQGMDLKDIDEEMTGALMVGMAVLRGEVLLPELRFQEGAYGAGISISETGQSRFMVYRAPSFEAALQCLQELPEDLRTLAQSITGKELEGYKVSVLSDLLFPVGKWDAAAEMLYREQIGLSAQERTRIREEVVNTTPEQLLEAADVLEKIIAEGRLVVLSDAEKINKQEAVFDTIYKIF